MAQNIFFICVIILILQCSPGRCFFIVVPEDVAMSFATIVGFLPRIFKGNDHRVGFGFRFGNHADVQILYEFGPQIVTKPLNSIKIRSAPRRAVRQSFLELLLRAGKQASYHHNVDDDNDDEPR